MGSVRGQESDPAGRLCRGLVGGGRAGEGEGAVVCSVTPSSKGVDLE